MKHKTNITILILLAGITLLACNNPFLQRHGKDGSDPDLGVIGPASGGSGGGGGGGDGGPSAAAKERYFTVTFDADGGSPVPGTQHIASGHKVSKVPAVNKAGSGFAGWFSDPGRTVEWHFATDMVNANMTLYAKWAGSSSSYSVWFDAEGGNPEPAAQQAAAGAKVSEPTPLRKTESEDPDRWQEADVWWGFDGWFTDEGFTNQWNFANDRVSGNMTLYAKWHEIVHSTVNFNANGGYPVPRRQNLVSGAKIVEPFAVIRDGFGFGGWYSDSRFNQLWNFAVDTVGTANITLYAKWVALDHTVSFNANGGSPAPKNLSVAHDALINPSDLPTMSRDSFGFDGWFTDPDFNNPWDFATRKVTGDMTLYAKWHTDFITVSFNITGDTPSVPPQYVTAGSRITEPNIRDAGSVCFDGWYEDSGFNAPWDFLMDTVSADKTLYGRWVPNLEAQGLIWVRGGGFTMGDDSVTGAKPAHRVKVSGFYMNKYLVTQVEYTAVRGVPNPSSSTTTPNLPVNNVSWADAVAYCAALGAGNRLPTEAEWEYAAKGGSNPSGNYAYAGSNNADAVSWYNQNSGKVIQPVGRKAPNDLGFYDMSGNLSEWCSDWLGDYSSAPQVNPTGPSSGTKRVTRGGSWDNSYQNTRVVIRGSFDPGSTSGSYPFWTLGIRYVRRPD